MTDTSLVRKALRDAVSLLETDGWTQGTARSESGSRCLLGALYDASERLGPDYIAIYITASDQVRDVARFDTRRDLFSITHWNDEPGRTVEEVIDLLKRAEEAL